MSLASQAQLIRKLAGARECCDRAVVIFEHLIRDHPDVPEHKNMLARTLVTDAESICLMGDYNQAVATVEKGVGIAPHDGLTCYNASCTYANISVAVGRDTKLSAKEREQLAERYASRAMGLLYLTKQAGFLQRLGKVASMAHDPDFDPLRKREDFKALMRELQSPQETPSSNPK